jgi:aminoglycoside phosphotransferase (APT) family kinase protein
MSENQEASAVSAEVLDKPRAVREGETLDVASLRRYLDQAAPELVGDIDVQQFPSGHFNLTYLLWVGETDVVMRRPPFGSKVKSAHDMGREHRILSALAKFWNKAPRPLAFCQDEAVLGAEFYIMQRIPGIILRKDLPSILALGPERMRRLCEALVDTLVELHGLDYSAAGLGDLGRPQGYVQRQVAGWTKRYHGSRTDDLPVVEQVAQWLDVSKPAEAAASLIHNDFKLDNLVLDPADPTRVIGVLDWEMSTIGCPLMDLGTTLSYWVDSSDPDFMEAARVGPTNVPGAFTRRELVARYQEKSGREVKDPLFYYVFGLFKTAVVLQQIYYRFKQGLTKDERFGALIYGVQGLCHRAATAIETASY